MKDSEWDGWKNNELRGDETRSIYLHYMLRTKIILHVSATDDAHCVVRLLLVGYRYCYYQREAGGGAPPRLAVLDPVGSASAWYCTWYVRMNVPCTRYHIRVPGIPGTWYVCA